MKLITVDGNHRFIDFEELGVDTFQVCISSAVDDTDLENPVLMTPDQFNILQGGRNIMGSGHICPLETFLAVVDLLPKLKMDNPTARQLAGTKQNTDNPSGTVYNPVLLTSFRRKLVLS